jgi:hypothetical protein
MNREEVQSYVHRDDFIPLRLHLSDHRKLEVPFHHVVVFRSTDIILFKGVKKPGSHVAQGYEVIPYDRIIRIEPRSSGSSRRKRAS